MTKRARRPRGTAKDRSSILDRAMAAVRIGEVPDVGSEEALGTVKIFDPYEERAWRDGHSARPVARVKVVSLRDDPLGRLHARGQVDEAQYVAGRKWQEYHHDAEIGTIKAIDTTRDVVDGGAMADAMTDRQFKAIGKMARYDRVLGQEGCALVRLILGQRMFIPQVMAMHGETSERMSRYFSQRFQECLETLAKEMGLVGGKRT